MPHIVSGADLFRGNCCIGEQASPWIFRSVTIHYDVTRQRLFIRTGSCESRMDLGEVGGGESAVLIRVVLALATHELEVVHTGPFAHAGKDPVHYELC